MSEPLPHFHYPPNPLSEEQLDLAAGLSSSHAVGDIQRLTVDPETNQRHPAQGAWRMDSQPIPTESLELIARDVYLPSGQVLEGLQNGDRSDRVKYIGQLLASGHTVVNAIPHSSISDIGLAHGLTTIALRNMGYEFNSGMVVSQGVTMLGREYHGHVVPVPDYLGFMCDTVWFVYPNTEKTAGSELAREVPGEVLKEHNGLVKNDMLEEQRKGGWFITSAVNATSYIKGKDGQNLLAGITPGTIATMTQRGTRVQRSLIELTGREEPVFEFYGPPLNLYTPGDVHDEVGNVMAIQLGKALPGERFIYLDPRSGMKAEDFQ